MIEATIFEKSTGRILRNGSFDSGENLLLNVDESEDAIAGYHDARQFYIQDYAPVTFPEKPGDWAVFDYDIKAWIDPRTPADLAAELDQHRQSANMTKIDFLLAVTAAKVISKEDAIAASKGEIPSSMSSIIETMTPAQQFEAKIRWGAATTINRMDPFINQWATVLEITDDQLDTIFGIGNDSL